MALETERKVLLPEVHRHGRASPARAPGMGFYVMAESAARVAGSLMVTNEWSDWRNGNFWWVQSVYVRPRVRRRGVYRELYKHLQSARAEDPSICGFRSMSSATTCARRQPTAPRHGADALHRVRGAEAGNPLLRAGENSDGPIQLLHGFGFCGSSCNARAPIQLRAIERAFRRSAVIAASAIELRSTSKNASQRARVSLRPKPSVPRAVYAAAPRADQVGERRNVVARGDHGPARPARHCST
jgi:GNAT superfamily N-acetyltransferase